MTGKEGLRDEIFSLQDSHSCDILNLSICSLYLRRMGRLNSTLISTQEHSMLGNQFV